MAYDILIKSGLVFDGLGRPGTKCDVGVKGDKIVAIGELGRASTGVTVSAEGKYVVPGFIDVTNHSDTHLSFFKYPGLESLIMQGITTAIGGNCGSSLAPLGKKEAIQAVRKWADPSEININWSTVDEYLAEVQRLRPAVNFGTTIGYGTLRRSVIGNDARILESDELESVKLLLAEGMMQGAFGMSLGLSYGHERVSPTEEVIDVVRILHKRGLVKIHLRSEGRELVASVNEAIRIGREAGVAVQISHLKAVGKNAWPSFSHVLDLIQNAKSSGVDINFDISPYSTTGSPLYLLIPAWARQGGFSDLFKKIDDPEERKKIITQIDAYAPRYDKIFIVSAKVDSIIGKTLAEIADYSSLPPAEALLEIVRANEGRVATVGHTVSVKNTVQGVINQNSFIASDGAGFSQESRRSGSIIHPRSFGAFPHFWHRYVNDLKLLTPEEAITKMTARPAVKFNIAGRGSIESGNFADIVVFDPKLMRDRATYRNPYRYPAGIDYVIINGTVAVEQGRFLGVRAGKVLKWS